MRADPSRDGPAPVRDKLMEHEQYITRYGDDMLEITGWKWGQEAGASARGRSTEADNI